LVRLKSATDFERVRRDGRSHAHPLVVLIARKRAPGEAGPGGELPARVGFAAGKGLGGAVVRNRAKRLLREAVRRREPQLVAGWDLVFIARRPIVGARQPAAQAGVDSVLERAGLIQPAAQSDTEVERTS
jgi:ribonuclease P protein component